MTGYIGAKTRAAEYDNYSREQLDDILDPVVNLAASKLDIDQNLGEIASNGQNAIDATKANLGLDISFDSTKMENIWTGELATTTGSFAFSVNLGAHPGAGLYLVEFSYEFTSTRSAVLIHLDPNFQTFGPGIIAPAGSSSIVFGRTQGNASQIKIERITLDNGVTTVNDSTTFYNIWRVKL